MASEVSVMWTWPPRQAATIPTRPVPDPSSRRDRPRRCAAGKIVQRMSALPFSRHQRRIMNIDEVYKLDYHVSDGFGQGLEQRALECIAQPNPLPGAPGVLSLRRLIYRSIGADLLQRHQSAQSSLRDPSGISLQTKKSSKHVQYHASPTSYKVLSSTFSQPIAGCPATDRLYISSAGLYIQLGTCLRTKPAQTLPVLSVKSSLLEEENSVLVHAF